MTTCPSVVVYGEGDCARTAEACRTHQQIRYAAAHLYWGGVQKYDGSGLTNLKYTEKDMTGLKAALEPLGYQFTPIMNYEGRIPPNRGGGYLNTGGCRK
jgi:hypothetical protein